MKPISAITVSRCTDLSDIILSINSIPNQEERTISLKAGAVAGSSKKKQEAIVKGGLDKQVLRAGLRSLPNLDKITVCEKFTPEHGSMARARINPTWPASLMEKLSGGTIPPIASESSTYGFHDYLNQGTITDIRFDCQHIVNLLDAVVSQCTMVREIHIGHQNAPMNLAIIADDRVLRSLQILVPQLKTLELHCRTGCQTEDPDFTKLTSLIQSAQNLQHLSINIGKYLWLWTKLLNELHFPHLVVLDIADIWLRTAVELEMFLSRHRKKLRKLTLEKGKLSMLAWDELSIAIGATLKLDYICLDSLSGPLALPTPTNDSLSADEMDLLVSYFMGESPFVIQRYGRQTTFGEEYVVLGYRQGCEPEEIPYEKEFLLHNVSFVN